MFFPIKIKRTLFSTEGGRGGGGGGGGGGWREEIKFLSEYYNITLLYLWSLL